LLLNKETYVYKKVKNCEIKADIYWENLEDLDEDIEVFNGKLTILVWIHGGGLIGGHRNNIKNDQLFWYLNAGYALISIDYRLAPETKLPEIIQDLKDAFVWIRTDVKENYPFNTDKIGVIGHSAGGYLTLMSGFCVDPAPFVLISFYGYGDITAPWYSEPDPYYCNMPQVSKEDAFSPIKSPQISNTQSSDNDRGSFYIYCRQNGLWPNLVSGLDIETEREQFFPYCPEYNVNFKYPPTLLLHGTNDTDVPWSQSEKMHEVLKDNKIITEFYSMEKGAHGFDGVGIFDPIVSEFFSKIILFLDRFLKN
jgi:acetyl esterase/lipase